MDTAQTSVQAHLERLTEVMSRTGMGRSWIYREISAGRFPAPIRIGGASRWHSAAIDNWIEEIVRKSERSV